jgi:PD-(D/E)XK nuclease superfamily
MQLVRRPSIYVLPSYSLTADLLGFLRCGLQYRYTRIGNLPSTRPVQLWFGQFIHGVMEESFRRFDTARKAGKINLPPWDDVEIVEICELLKARLAAQGIYPYDSTLEALGDERAKRAINELRPELFPLIRRAEVRLTGSRLLPTTEIPKQYQFRESDRFEMVGVIDVISNLELQNPDLNNNRFVRAILEELPENPPELI